MKHFLVAHIRKARNMAWNSRF